VYRRRFLVAYGFVGVVAAAVSGALLWQGGRGAPGDGPRCGHAIPSGSTIPAAWNTSVLFVTEVVLRRDPACGYDLSTRRLRGPFSRREWASGAGPVKPFVTRYPPTPVVRASRDPNAPQAVYVLSRKVREMAQIDGRGRWTIPISVGLAAPDAGMSAYRLVLELEDGSWRVDRASRVTLRFSDE
jgi:hypothetical protein